MRALEETNPGRLERSPGAQGNELQSHDGSLFIGPEKAVFSARRVRAVTAAARHAARFASAALRSAQQKARESNGLAGLAQPNQSSSD